MNKLKTYDDDGVGGEVVKVGWMGGWVKGWGWRDGAMESIIVLEVTYLISLALVLRGSGEWEGGEAGWIVCCEHLVRDD